MADLDKYATKRDLAAVTGLAANVYTVGNANTGAVFATVQEGVDECGDDIDAGTYTEGLVLVYPGTYLEDVTVTRSGVHVVGLGGTGDVVIRSLTVTDASAASVTTFNTSGTFTDLTDGAYTTPPVAGSVQNVTLYRDAAAGAWHDTADHSLRLLGTDTVNGTFLNTKYIVANCRVLKAANSAAGQGGIVGCYGNQLEIENSLITGGVLFSQYAVKSVAHTTFLSTGMFDDTYDSAATKPVTAFSPTQLINCHIAGELEINGDTCDFAASGCYIGSIDLNSTAAGSASTAEDCHIAGAVDNANLNATLTITGGEMTAAVTGAGAASVTVTARTVTSSLVPGTDNSVSLGSTSKAYANVHSRQLEAHADATDSVKTYLTSASVRTKGSNLQVEPGSQATAETAGYTATLAGGTGGACSGAGAGGAGGAAYLQGAVGGDGSAGQLPGAGGGVIIAGGEGGSNGGAGGAVGGNVSIRAGQGSGAAANGDVQVGLTNTTKIEVGTGIVSDTDNTDSLGTTAKAFKAIHGRSLVAHSDTSDISKTTIAAATITPTVAHTMQPTAAADDTAGKNETVKSGDGGASSAAAGGAGGTATFGGGAGGAGGAAQLAGAGGAVSIKGGNAGADGGGGGAAGGDVTIAGGTGTGAARPGYVATTSAFKCHAIALAGRAALGLGGGDAGCMIFCTDAGPAGVGIPLWWDGAAWRDAAGNVVA